MNIDYYEPISHEKFKKEALQDSKVRQAYEELEDEFALIAEMIKARKIAHKTQQEVAKNMHTSQAVVSRIENGFSYQQHSPTFNTLKKYAKALGCRLLIKLVPEHSHHRVTQVVVKHKE